MNSPLSITFPGNCEDALEYLRKSPTFAMSLGAKELFHTNFLAYLLEYKSNDKTLKSIQTRLKMLLFGHDEIGRVITWREKYSLDLVIMPAPVIEVNQLGLDGIGPKSKEKLTIAVVIEAKLKSIPTQQQLEEYDLKLKSGITFELDDTDQRNNDAIICKFMKLSVSDSQDRIEMINENNKKGGIKKFDGKIRRILLGPTALKETGWHSHLESHLESHWEHITWDDVVKCLVIEPNRTGILQCEETELLQRLICEYRESLKNILGILATTTNYVTNAIKDRSDVTTYRSYYDAITAKRFTEHRIHDLVGKYANNVLEGNVFKNLQTKFDACEFNICDKSFMLNSYTFFSNQQPGVTFEWLCKKGKSEVSFGVTIQGYDYRHFISVDGKDKAARCLVLKELEGMLSPTNNEDWFLNSQNLKMKLTKKNKDTFYVFDESKFRYSKINISELYLSELSEAVILSLRNAQCMVVKENAGFCNQLTEFFKVKSSI